MKLPSLRLAVEDAQHTLLRFPVVLADAAIGTFVALILLDYEGPAQPSVLFQILYASLLGIPLFTGVALVAEKMGWSRAVSWLAHAAGGLLLVGYSTTVPQNLTHAPAAETIRFLLLAVALHLFVAVAPFSTRHETNGFWQYNKSLFFRVLSSILYSHVLYAGLALALAALDNLFGMNIPGKRYGELWVLLIGLFGTWFFLAGVPRSLRDLEGVTDYPKGLKIFTNYVVLPLVLIYLVILYAYLAKILVTWEWPEGWVSKLILGFSGTGIFSYLLLYPVTVGAERGWLKNASRRLFSLMLPVVLMLFFAIWRRVSEYGWTEGRYLAVALGVWLAFLTGYFLLSKKPNIKLIPATLCVAAILVSFGPWSTLAVSEHSQVERLRTLLTQQGILFNGSVRKAPADIPFKDVREISSVLTYLHEIHGYGGIQPWFAESLQIDSLGEGAFKAPAEITALLGVEYVRVRPGRAGGILTLNADRDAPAYVQGYSHALRRQWVNSERRRMSNPGAGITYSTNKDLDSLIFLVTGADSKVDTVQVSLRGVLDSLVLEYGNTNSDKIPPGKMMAAGVTGATKVLVYFLEVHVQREERGSKILFYDADFFYSSLH